MQLGVDHDGSCSHLIVFFIDDFKDYTLTAEVGPKRNSVPPSLQLLGMYVVRAIPSIPLYPNEGDIR